MVTQWVKHKPAEISVLGSIPSRGGNLFIITLPSSSYDRNNVEKGAKSRHLFIVPFSFDASCPENLVIKQWQKLTLLTTGENIAEFKNSIDLAEVAHDDLHCLPSSF